MSKLLDALVTLLAYAIAVALLPVLVVVWLGWREHEREIFLSLMNE